MLTATYSRQNAHGKIFAANVDDKMFTANIGISGKHDYLHMKHNIWDLGDLGEAWHAMWSGHRRRCPLRARPCCCVLGLGRILMANRQIAYTLGRVCAYILTFVHGKMSTAKCSRQNIHATFSRQNVRAKCLRQHVHGKVLHVRFRFSHVPRRVRGRGQSMHPNK